MENPEIGDIIAGTGGLRKIRWSLANKGKRGGIRIIYYWQAAVDRLYLYLLTLYAKIEKIYWLKPKVSPLNFLSTPKKKFI